MKDFDEASGKQFKGNLKNWALLYRPQSQSFFVAGYDDNGNSVRTSTIQPSNIRDSNGARIVETQNSFYRLPGPPDAELALAAVTAAGNHAHKYIPVGLDGHEGKPAKAQFTDWAIVRNPQTGAFAVLGIQNGELTLSSSIKGIITGAVITKNSLYPIQGQHAKITDDSTKFFAAQRGYSEDVTDQFIQVLGKDPKPAAPAAAPALTS